MDIVKLNLLIKIKNLKRDDKMITEELKQQQIICKGKGLFCNNCKDKKECVDFIELKEKKRF